MHTLKENIVDRLNAGEKRAKLLPWSKLAAHRAAVTLAPTDRRVRVAGSNSNTDMRDGNRFYPNNFRVNA